MKAYKLNYFISICIFKILLFTPNIFDRYKQNKKSTFFPLKFLRGMRNLGGTCQVDNKKNYIILSIVY